MKCKDRFYNINHHYETTIDEWFEYKDYYLIIWKSQPAIQKLLGINLQPKRRHRRSIASRHEVRLFGKHLHPIWTVYTRPARPIGRKKHGKWLYMPKRIKV